MNSGSHPIQPGEFDDSLVSASDCRALWSAKILAYMSDALQGHRAAGNLHPTIAQGWFGTEDFYTTCACAGVEPEAVLDGLQTRIEAANRGDRKAAAAGLRGVRR